MKLKSDSQPRRATGRPGCDPAGRSIDADGIDSYVFRELKRVLRDTGSVWLNIGDTDADKRLLGIPWRVALELTDAPR
jgi:hypothetical protein